MSRPRHPQNPDLNPSDRWRMLLAMESGEQLCRACGLCCDGSLFDGVQLGAGDDAKKLKSLGLPVTVSRGKNPITRFAQPCVALCADRSCRAYVDRPGQCRVFECGVFKDAKVGRIEFPAALRLVKQGRRRADKVRRLLRELGDNDEHLSVSERFHRTSERLEASNSDAATNSTFADLSLAVHHLKLLAYNKFYTKTAAGD